MGIGGTVGGLANPQVSQLLCPLLCAVFVCANNIYRFLADDSNCLLIVNKVWTNADKSLCNKRSWREKQYLYKITITFHARMWWRNQVMTHDTCHRCLWKMSGLEEEGKLSSCSPVSWKVDNSHSTQLSCPLSFQETELHVRLRPHEKQALCNWPESPALFLFIFYSERGSYQVI